MKLKIKYFIYTLIIVAIPLMIFHMVNKEKNHLKEQNYIKGTSYTSEVGIYGKYEKTIEKKGQPLKELIDKYSSRTDRWLAYYDGMIAVYEYNEESKLIGSLIQVQINSAEYGFGKQNVCIGMEEKEIAEIFKNSKVSTTKDTDTRIIYDENGVGTEVLVQEYFDDGYEFGIGFWLDENGKVKNVLLYNCFM